MDFLSSSFSFDELKSFLDTKVEEFNTPDFLDADPLGIVHRFSKKQDIEIMGFFMSTIAWGNRKSIITSGERFIELFENDPFGFIQHHQEKDFKKVKFVHRTFNTSDLQFLSKGLQTHYLTNDSLESAFYSQKDYPGIKGRIVSFRETLLKTPHERRSEKHLANPLKKSAAKRLNMYLRWMVRNDKKGVDFGIWKNISPAELYLPLDVHTSNFSRKLGLLTRKQDDWQALEELMENLRGFDPLDPCKYDFALFGLGAIEKR